MPATFRLLAACATALALASCGGGDDAPGPAAVGDTVAITDTGRIVSFNRAAPGTRIGSRAISGLVAGETLLGIDFRPSNGLLYALGSRGNIYTLSASTGLATLRGSLRAAAGDDLPFFSLQGTQFGLDFNPVADRLRVVSNAGQSLRINVDTGEAITDGDINRVDGTGAPAVSAITAAAYTNAFRGSTATQLYVLDMALGSMFLVDPPNAGTLTSGRNTGLGGGGERGINGFDIEARGNNAYVAVRVGSEVALYRIDLSTPGTPAVKVGDIGGDTLTGLALVQPD